jgi:hypothetical protein
MKTTPFLALVFGSLGLSAAFAQSGKPDKEGFIHDWLVLAPLSIEGSTGADEIDKKQLANEADPKAKEGGKQKVGNKELTWKKMTAPDFFLDFKELFPDQSENVIGWAVAYVLADQEKKDLTLKMNSNDQGKVYLNGKELAKFSETRTLEKNQEDTAKGVTLNKGVNVLVLKVINETNNWQGSVRFLDKDGKPVTDLKVQATQ